MHACTNIHALGRVGNDTTVHDIPGFVSSDVLTNAAIAGVWCLAVLHMGGGSKGAA
jgi:hypothetical protein